MADGPHPDGPAGRGGRIYQGWPGPARGGGAQPVLDLGFDSGMLHTARAQMRACQTGSFAVSTITNSTTSVGSEAGRAGSGRSRWAIATSSGGPEKGRA